MSAVPSVRARDVPSFKVMDVLKAAAARAARDPDTRVLHLEAGQPATPAPAVVSRVAAEALQNQSPLGYTEAGGSLPLRQAISRMYRQCYDPFESLPGPEDILITTGSSGAFIVAFTYPCYPNVLKALGCEVVPIDVSEGDNYQPTVGQLQEAQQGLGGQLKGLILASPSNPTGTLLSPARLRELSEYCSQHAMHLISDEIYHRITYDEPAHTALEFNPDAVVINSLSKYYSMTGWRVGWIVVRNARIREAMEVLLQNMFICAPALSQEAAVAAFTQESQDELERHIQKYSENRRVLVERLPHCGFPLIHACQGAFYLYVNVRALLGRGGCRSSGELCQKILDDVAVAITPGDDFDPQRGMYHVRFSFAQSTADMHEACDRLAAWAARLPE